MTQKLSSHTRIESYAKYLGRDNKYMRSKNKENVRDFEIIQWRSKKLRHQGNIHWCSIQIDLYLVLQRNTWGNETETNRSFSMRDTFHYL